MPPRKTAESTPEPVTPPAGVPSPPAAEDVKRGEPGSRKLKIGSEGDDVIELQRVLNGRIVITGAQPLKLDGKFGEVTEHMVKVAQSRYGLTADGEVGPETWRALRVIR